MESETFNRILELARERKIVVSDHGYEKALLLSLLKITLNIGKVHPFSSFMPALPVSRYTPFGVLRQERLNRRFS